MNRSVNSIAITGANGFIGSALRSALAVEGRNVRSIVRANKSQGDVAVGDIGPDTDWSEAVIGIDCIIHLAARVHIMNDSAPDLLAAYRGINVGGTLSLARQAAVAGVKRFIYLSSIKVNGESTSNAGHQMNHGEYGSINQVGEGIFTAHDTAAPSDAYAVSKWEAEQGLFALAAETGLEVTVIRPPLVYGPGVKANFLTMMRWLNNNIPLPFGSIRNKRSLVGVDNLVDLIITCIDHPAAANQVFLVSDGEDLSTTELLTRTAIALGKTARLVPVPQGLIEFGLKIMGKKDLAQRLCGTLQVDISKTRELLAWTPPVSVDEGLRKTADAFLNELP